MIQPAEDAQRTASLNRLTIVVDSQWTLLKRFLGILEQEEALLIEGDSDALMALAEEKNEVYHLLQRQHDACAILAGQFGLPNSAESIRQICAEIPNTLARWEEVLTLASEAQVRNETNGKLIIEQMQNNQAALTILLSAAERPQLYSADGSARPTGSGRILGSA